MRIAIVEDNKEMQQQLHNLLKETGEDFNLDLKIALFDDGVSFIDSFNDDFDLVYLDVEMPQLNGMDTAKLIRNHPSSVHLVFVTNYVQYAIEGYSVEAFDFILKPINDFTFKNHFKKFLKSYAQQDTSYSLTIKYKNEVTRLLAQDILYIESEGHYLHFYTKDEKVTAIDTLKQYEEELVDQHFFRANNHYLINLKYVSSVKDDIAYVENHELKISRPRKKNFMKALTEYLGDQ